MEKISNIISKKVISLEDASQLGYVLDVIFDDQVKVFMGLIVVDDESENSFVLQRGDIYSTGENVIMIKSADKLQFNISSLSNNPIGKTVYDSSGNCLGQVCDVELQGKMVRKIITNKCEFPQRFLRKSGDNFLIFGRAKKEKNKPQKDKNFKVEIGEFNVKNLPQVTISNAINSSCKTECPTRIYAENSGLIGRIVMLDILGYNNELIAKKNDKITQKIITKAKKHNKMNLLSYYSR